MSRFTDTVERDLKVIADRATPSPDAWDTDPIPDRRPGTLSGDGDHHAHREHTHPPTVAPRRSCGCGRGDRHRRASPSSTATTASEQPADVPTPTVAPAPEPETASNAVTELPPIDSQVTPGRYTSDTPGVTVTFTLDEGQTAPWTLTSNQEPGGIQLWSDDSGREFMAIGRVGSWYDADEARDGDMTGLGSIPPDDIDGWIEQNGVIVTESAERRGREPTGAVPADPPRHLTGCLRRLLPARRTAVPVGCNRLGRHGRRRSRVRFRSAETACTRSGSSTWTTTSRW